LPRYSVNFRRLLPAAALSESARRRRRQIRRNSDNQMEDGTGGIRMPNRLPAEQPQAEPWDRLPQETARAFHAFCLFRDQLGRRTLEQVAQMLSCSQQNVARWAIRRDWADRCRAYDRHLDDLQRAELIEERREMRRRQIEIAMELQGIAEEEIAELQKRVDQGLSLNLTPAAICRP